MLQKKDKLKGWPTHRYPRYEEAFEDAEVDHLAVDAVASIAEGNYYFRFLFHHSSVSIFLYSLRVHDEPLSTAIPKSGVAESAR